MTYAAAAAAAKSLQLCPTQCNPREDSDAHRRTGERGVDWGGFTGRVILKEEINFCYSQYTEPHTKPYPL